MDKKDLVKFIIYLEELKKEVDIKILETQIWLIDHLIIISMALSV